VCYLGHVISADGVSMDSDKVAAMDSWPTLKTLRALCRFLGLTGYYHKFIANYGDIAWPLTALLKCNAFRWSPEADVAFQCLKQALMTAPVLQLPDFNKQFVIECDASGSGFGAVLHRGDGHIVFFSQPVAPHHAKLPAYECELIGLVKAVRHWRPFVWGRFFIICSDHFSLKFILDQWLTTIPQHTWVSKLFGYDFVVEYQQGKFNIVADALSRRDEDLLEVHSLSSPSFILSDQLREEMSVLPQACQLLIQMAEGSAPSRWSEKDGMLMFQGHIFLPDDSTLWLMVLENAHMIGHEGNEKMLHRFHTVFYSPHARRRVRDYMRTCEVCQRNKTEHLHLVGLLQPLPIPHQV
jgi:hypothetical protein